jgi:hypothetical protein
LESVLGASPREFESRILRHADQQRRWASGRTDKPSMLLSLIPSLIQSKPGWIQPVGRASQRKKQAQAQRRDRPALIKKLKDQLELLRMLGEAFDSGSRVVAYPLATTIRVLVHRTGSSHALLAQLDELSKMPFLDTALPVNPRNMLKSHGGLVIMKMTSGTGIEWVPRKEVPPVPLAQPHDIPFRSWWENDITRDSIGNLWSRRNLVLSIANKEGGAHIDPAQPLDIHAIEEENSMGWTYNDALIHDQPASNGPLLPSIRQIAYEVELSIMKHFSSEIVKTAHGTEAETGPI